MDTKKIVPLIFILFLSLTFISAELPSLDKTTPNSNLQFPSLNGNQIATTTSSGEPLWNANYSNYLVVQGYALNNTGGEPLWNANYSNFLLSYNYATNGTFRPITNFTFYGKNVGINTINPENSTLVVNGGALIGGTNLVTSHNDSLQVIGDYDSANNVSFIQLLADNKTYWGLSYEYNYPLGAFQIFGDYFNDPTATVPSLIFGTANYKNRQLTLEPNSGFVGINTNTPQNNLNVVGDFNATDIIWSEGRNLTLGYDYATNGTFISGGINWANAVNGTLLTYLEALNGTLMLQSNWNATNTSYLTIANWNATNTSYASWANILNGTMPKFSDLNQTNTSYYLNTNPYSFYNVTNFPQNSSLMTYANWNSTNTSYALLNGTDIFVGNNTFNLSNSNGYFDVINKTGSGASILFYINNSNGRIGIGNSSPTASFQVTSLNSNKFTTSSWNRAIEIPNAAVFKWTKGANNAWAIGQTGDSFYIMSSTADDASASVSYRLYISSTGQVGINTTSPQNTLNVLGTTNSTSGFAVQNATGKNYNALVENSTLTGLCWLNYTGGILTASNC